jgi:serine/threonine-protein kinase
MGVVFEARHRSLGRRVAIKVLHGGFSGKEPDPSQAKRFLREGRAAAQVRHPHVVDVFDFGVENGVSFLVMELVEGESLADRIGRQGALPLAEVVELLLPVVSAVGELHAAGIVHRDLKPANILLARDSAGNVCPKVADFGVSRLSDGSSGITNSGVCLGTYAYMPPEQMRTSKDPTEQIDQYALGVTLYESATGTLPFDAGTPFALMNAVMNESVAPPSARNRLLPKAFDEIVLRAMRRDPRERYACVEELGEALLPFAEPRVKARWANDFQAPGSHVATVRKSPRPALWALAVTVSVAGVATAAWAIRPAAGVAADKAHASAQAAVVAPPVAMPPRIDPQPSSALPVVPVTLVTAAPTVDEPPPAAKPKPMPMPVSRPRSRPPSPGAPSEARDNGAPIVE